MIVKPQKKASLSNSKSFNPTFRRESIKVGFFIVLPIFFIIFFIVAPSLLLTYLPFIWCPLLWIPMILIIISSFIIGAIFVNLYEFITGRILGNKNILMSDNKNTDKSSEEGLYQEKKITPITKAQQAVISYVLNAKQRGLTEGEINTILKQHGWSDDDIKNAYSIIKP